MTYIKWICIVTIMFSCKTYAMLSDQILQTTITLPCKEYLATRFAANLQSKNISTYQLQPFLAQQLGSKKMSTHEIGILVNVSLELSSDTHGCTPQQKEALFVDIMQNMLLDHQKQLEAFKATFKYSK